MDMSALILVREGCQDRCPQRLELSAVFRQMK